MTNPLDLVFSPASHRIGSDKNSLVMAGESFDISYEVQNGTLYLNKVDRIANKKIEKLEYQLGENHTCVVAKTGEMLFYADQAYYTNRKGDVFYINIPEEFTGSLHNYQIIDAAFEQSAIFVLYKSPNSHNESGVCYMYDTKIQTSLNIQADKAFHNAIISDVKNLHYHCNDIVRGFVVVELPFSIQKFACRNIIDASSNQDDLVFEAMIGGVETFHGGFMGLTHTGSFHHISQPECGLLQGITGNFLYQLFDDKIVIHDTQKEVVFDCIIPIGYTVIDVQVDKRGDVYCLLEDCMDQETHSILYASNNDNYENVKNIPIPYMKVRGFLKLSSSHYDIGLVAKEYNKQREFVLLRIKDISCEMIGFTLDTRDLDGDIYLYQEGGIYYLTSIISDINSTILSSISYVTMSDTDTDIMTDIATEQHNQKLLDWYKIHVLENNGQSYQSLVERNQDLTKQLESVKFFFDKFELVTKKTLLGDLRERIVFDEDEIISLLRSIKEHDLFSIQDSDQSNDIHNITDIEQL